MIINENYQMTSDGEMNVILMKKFEKKKKEGESVQYGFKAVGYYRDVKHLLRDFVRKEILATELKDMETIVNKIEELENTIDNLNI